MTKHRNQSHQVASLWLVTFGDLMTLVFCFVVVTLPPEAKSSEGRGGDRGSKLQREASIVAGIPRAKEERRETSSDNILTLFYGTVAHSELVRAENVEESVDRLQTEWKESSSCSLVIHRCGRIQPSSIGRDVSVGAADKLPVILLEGGSCERDEFVQLLVLKDGG